jgi:hypothetical protein
MGAFIFTVSMPTSEAKPAGCYRKLSTAERPDNSKQKIPFRISALFAFSAVKFSGKNQRSLNPP